MAEWPNVKAESTPNAPKFIWPICLIGPKVWDIVEKRLHRASVVPAHAATALHHDPLGK